MSLARSASEVTLASVVMICSDSSLGLTLDRSVWMAPAPMSTLSLRAELVAALADLVLGQKVAGLVDLAVRSP